MDSQLISNILIAIVGIITVVGAIGVVGAFFAMGRQGYRKD